MELIPDDLRKTFKKIVGENIVKIEIILKNYLKMTDFHEKEYEPVVDFSKQQIFNKIENIQGIEIITAIPTQPFFPFFSFNLIIYFL